MEAQQTSKQQIKQLEETVESWKAGRLFSSNPRSLVNYTTLPVI